MTRKNERKCRKNPNQALIFLFFPCERVDCVDFRKGFRREKSRRKVGFAEAQIVVFRARHTPRKRGKSPLQEREKGLLWGYFQEWQLDEFLPRFLKAGGRKNQFSHRRHPSFCFRKRRRIKIFRRRAGKGWVVFVSIVKGRKREKTIIFI